MNGKPLIQLPEKEITMDDLTFSPEELEVYNIFQAKIQAKVQKFIKKVRQLVPLGYAVDGETDVYTHRARYSRNSIMSLSCSYAFVKPVVIPLWSNATKTKRRKLNAKKRRSKKRSNEPPRRLPRIKSTS